MASNSQSILKTIVRRIPFMTEIVKFLAFEAFLICIPALFICFTAVRISKILWHKLMSNRFPHLEFVKSDTVRTLLDTHRNQGVVNVLLIIKGKCSPNVIKSKLMENVVEKMDKYQQYCFPRLKNSLVSCWGNYAWKTNCGYDLDNHLIITNPVFRYRPVSDANLQDCISEIVSKYLPPELPPWQVIIIPSILSTEEKYAILVRVHHLLLSGEHSLNIGDMLLMQDPTESQQVFDEADLKNTPLLTMLKSPDAIPEFYSRISDSFSNRWNEFISEYDPMESPQAMKSNPGVFHCFGLFLIIFISTCREFLKRNEECLDEPAKGIKHFFLVMQNEFRRREFTASKMSRSIFITLHPIKVVKTLITYSYWIAISCTIKIPIVVLQELLELRSRIFLKYGSYPDTFVSILWQYLPLILGSLKEIAYMGEILYSAPNYLFEELVIPDENSKKHHLQTASLCGRKVAAWSQSIARKDIQEISLSTGASETEVKLCATMEALKEYFRQAGQPTPDRILVSARTVTQDFLTASSKGNGKFYKKTQTGCMVCLSLPMPPDTADENHMLSYLKEVSSTLRISKSRQLALAAISTAQTRYGMITRLFPSALVRLVLNIASRRFAVSITEVVSPPSQKPFTRRTLWGQQVLDVIYWRPPQANISMSLTVQHFGDSVRLAVMADAELSPAHAAPASHWDHGVESLKRASAPARAPTKQATTLLAPPVRHDTLSPPVGRRLL